MTDPSDIRTKVADALDNADPDKVQQIIDDILDMTKLKWGFVDFTCRKCGDVGRYKAQVETPDYKARSDALVKLIDGSGKSKQAPEVSVEISQAQIDEMVQNALDRMLSGPVTDEQLARLATT